MPQITINPGRESFEYEVGLSLLDILLSHDVFVDNPCNGKGVCGKCKVKILGDNCPESSPTEIDILSQKELNEGIRLSCMLYPKTDLEIELLQKEGKHEVLTDGYIPEFEFDINIKKVVFSIEKPNLTNQTPYEEQIKNKLKVSDISLDILRNVELLPGIMTGVLYHDRLIALESGDTSQKLYGVAIDIGTTTVVCSLIDMLSGMEMENASMINAQKHFGLDVLTRITYEVENPQTGAKNLQKAIIDSLNDMIFEVCKKAEISAGNIYEISVAANCTMMHMLLGVNAATLGKSPYAPVFIEAKDISASEIGLKAAMGARVYCLPSVSSYIGADIVAGAYVCSLHSDRGKVLFIDIGTNGEIVLSIHGKMLSCSCAAGPALEGMNITAGMRAQTGAIENVKIEKDKIILSVIGDGEPIGICGSGILAAIKELIKHKLITKSGAFVKKNELKEDDYRYNMIKMNGIKREFILKDDPGEILITQGDVRQVQLSKGAILSGFLALLNEAKINMVDLDRVIIAGQFGAHLPSESLTGTGILPKEVEDKIEYVGNTSKTGAYMALMSAAIKREMEKLSKNMDYMELGTCEGYEKLFSECLLFQWNS